MITHLFSSQRVSIIRKEFLTGNNRVVVTVLEGFDLYGEIREDEMVPTVFRKEITPRDKRLIH